MDKVCACRGVNLLRDMMDAYQLFIDGNQGYRAKMKRVAPQLHDHMVAQSELPANKALRATVKPLLDKQKNVILASKYGDSEPTQAMEVVRDDIHKSDALKKLVLCGVGKSDTDKMSFEMVKLAFRILAGEGTEYQNADVTPDVAKAPLDELVTMLSC